MLTTVFFRPSSFQTEGLGTRLAYNYVMGLLVGLSLLFRNNFWNNRQYWEWE